jgi:hypothetical protein
MVKLGLMLIGLTLVLVIFAFALYVVFFPLVRTVGGGLQILRIFGSRNAGAFELKESPAFLAMDPELGPTMADGGERTEEQRDATTRK